MALFRWFMMKKKKDRLKVSAKEVLNRKDLQTFHDDLNKHLKESCLFMKGILNDKHCLFKMFEEKKYNETYIKK